MKTLPPRSNSADSRKCQKSQRFRDLPMQEFVFLVFFFVRFLSGTDLTRDSDKRVLFLYPRVAPYFSWFFSLLLFLSRFLQPHLLFVLFVF